MLEPRYIWVWPEMVNCAWASELKASFTEPHNAESWDVGNQQHIPAKVTKLKYETT